MPNNQPIAARAYLTTCASLFGLADADAELTVAREERIASRRQSVVRYRQLHKNLPVIGGELIVHVDDARNIVAVAGRTSADLDVDPAPAVAAAAAAQAAVGAVASEYGLSSDDLVTSVPELSVYDPQLIGPGLGAPGLVWRVEVTPRALLPIDEFVLVDAQRGTVVLRFNQVDTALSRQTYTAGNTTTLPGTLVCDETNPSCSNGDAHAAAAHQHAAETYNFYLNVHGRNSIANAGMTMASPIPAQPQNNSSMNIGREMPVGSPIRSR